MTSTPAPPPRRVREIVLIAIGMLLSLLALLLPILVVNGVPVGILIAPFTDPIQSAADVVAFVLFLFLLAGLIVPHVLLLRAVIRRRAAGAARIVVVAAAIIALLWGLFFSSYAFSSPSRFFAIPAVLCTILAAVTLLIGQAAILGRLNPTSRRWR